MTITKEITLTDNIRARLERAGQADLDAWLAGSYYCWQQGLVCGWIDDGHELMHLDLDDGDEDAADHLAASQITILEYCGSCDMHRTADHYFTKQGDLIETDYTDLLPDDLADLMNWDDDYLDEIRQIPNQFETVAWLAEGRDTTEFLKCKHGYTEGWCQYNCELYDRTRFDDDSNADVSQLLQLKINSLIARLMTDDDRQQLTAEFNSLLAVAEEADLIDDLIFYMQDWQARHQPTDRLTLAVAELAATMSV